MSMLQRLAQPVRRCSRGLASDVRTVTLIPGDGIGTYRVHSHAPSIRSRGFPDFQPIRFTEKPVCRLHLCLSAISSFYLPAFEISRPCRTASGIPDSRFQNCGFGSFCRIRIFIYRYWFELNGVKSSLVVEVQCSIHSALMNFVNMTFYEKFIYRKNSGFQIFLPGRGGGGQYRCVDNLRICFLMLCGMFTVSLCR